MTDKKTKAGKGSGNKNLNQSAVRERKADAREAAFRSLTRCFENDKFSNIEVDSAIKKFGLEGSDKALFTLLVYGVIEKKITLDYIISRFSSKPIEKLEPQVLMILRMGVYQIVFCDRIPDSAACSESVELAKRVTHKGTSGFVNGILRSVARGKESIEYPSKEKNLSEYLSIYYSCPKWLCDMWIGAYGSEKCTEILEAISCPPTITLRVNTLKTSRGELIGSLPESVECETAPYGVRLLDSTPISRIPQIEEGLCFVQDEASQLCTYAIGARPGETVMDICSCPGGKSFGIAMDMQNSGRLLSLDLHENKLSLVKKGAEKLGIRIIETGVNDGSVLKEEYINSADRVLCDVPCSGLGVIAKKPDLRYKNPTDIDRLPDIQYAILNTCCEYVKNGGTLIYSTCTLNPKENESIVRKFLAEHTEFRPDPSLMPDRNACVTIFPNKSGGDGFFIAKFIKSAD